VRDPEGFDHPPPLQLDRPGMQAVEEPDALSQQDVEKLVPTLPTCFPLLHGLLAG
jgi:hypothetical protein